MIVTPDKAYQWNTNVTVKLSVSAVKAGFSYSKQPPGKVVDRNEDGTFTIPQELMESCGFLNVYAINDSDDAFDQPETQIVRDMVAANTDAMLFVDFHTNGSTNVSEWTKCNWHSFTPGVLKDRYYKNLYYASGYHITNITAHFISDYGLSTDGHQCGSVSTDTNADAATAKAWAESLGVMSLTFEGFNGFPSESADYSENTQRANAELIGNYIASVLSVFAQAD